MVADGSRKVSLSGSSAGADANIRQISPESAIPLDNFASSGQSGSPGRCLEPIAYFPNGVRGITSVCPNILPGNIRNELSVSVLFAIQYLGPLSALIL